MRSRTYKLMGCCTSLFFMVGIVFSVIIMVESFTKGVNWLTAFFLIYGAVGICLHAAIIPALLFCKGYDECEREEFCER